MNQTRAFGWAAIVWGSASSAAGVVLYFFAVSGRAVLPDSMAVPALVTVVHANFLWSQGRWFRPSPKPLIQVTPGRVLASQILLYGSCLLCVGHLIGLLFFVSAPESQGFLLQASSLVASLVIATSVTMVCGYLLCLHNVVFFVMPPEP